MTHLCDNAFPETTGDAKIFSHTENNSNIVEATNMENTVPPYSNGVSSEKVNSKVTEMVIRRSSRLKSSALPNGKKKVEQSVEHVNLVESGKEEAPDHQQVGTLPVVTEKNVEEEATQMNVDEEAPQMNVDEEAPEVQQLHTVPVVTGRNLEEKVDYIIQAVDEFKSKAFKQVTKKPDEGSSMDLSYKSLYIDSQKKIEALMEKHYELVKELEFARGKVDAYEKMNNVIAASKEVVLVARLEKDAEAIKLSPQTVQHCISAAAPDANAAHKVSSKQQKKYCRKRKAKS
ncbi:uncharacterized protein LOC105163261 isoform X2 [Sesamum indicum]|uniref:Uncharacterized protein LOC105163261 isoform X2 n=1 Tax=Sesamum indicum TaxID=4182 RepID=A0A8M8UV53_SESIN|nr:uncharacterized protein LOC105163261 isoform X2 [Sesamum indicum]